MSADVIDFEGIPSERRYRQLIVNDSVCFANCEIVVDGSDRAIELLRIYVCQYLFWIAAIGIERRTKCSSGDASHSSEVIARILTFPDPSEEITTDVEALSDGDCTESDHDFRFLDCDVLQKSSRPIDSFVGSVRGRG